MNRVGITADWEVMGGGKRLVLNDAYVHWLAGAGMIPVVLPSLPGLENQFLNGLAALVLSGGGDLRPQLYGGDPEPLSEETYSHPERSAFEFALLWRSMRVGLPVLGICLGCQTINAALGGDVIRHLDDPGFHHRRASPDRPAPRHRLHVEADSTVGSLYPSPDTRVTSSHHQALGRIAPGWRPTAWGPGGVVEAIEHPAYPRILGVQWHPERTPRSQLSVNLASWLKGEADAYRFEQGAGRTGDRVIG